MKYLITGGSGFIGSHLLRLLHQKGYSNLRATSHSRGLRNDFEGCENIPLFKGNLQDAKFCVCATKSIKKSFILFSIFY